MTDTTLVAAGSMLTAARLLAPELSARASEIIEELSHAEWFLNGVLVMNGETPRLPADGTRDYRCST